MIKNIIIRPGFLGRPESIFTISDVDPEELIATYSVGLIPKTKLNSLRKKLSFGDECDNSNFIDMSLNEEHAGLAAIRFMEYDDEDSKNANCFIATLNFVALDKKFQKKGISSYFAEQCGYFAASAMLQHMIINNIKKCEFIFLADFISDGGERFFFKMIEFTDQALNVGAKIAKLKYTLVAETDSLKWDFRSEGPRT
ncbi:hypothetical protein IFT69_15165 [Pseudomonas putida]|nr:hypothetical protein [Pseudomonas putida]